MSDRNLSVSISDANDWNGKRDEVIRLFGMGYGPAFVAKYTSIPISTVEKIRRTEFQDRNSDRQKIIEAHSATVQWMKLKLTERIHDAGKLWDRRDLELLLKVVERESKLFGTDQPTQHNVQVQIEDMTDDDLVRQLRAEGVVIQLPPAQLKALSEAVADAQYTVHLPNDSADRQPPVTSEIGPDSCGERPPECGVPE